MKIRMYNKAPLWWTTEEWMMTPQEREKVGIKIIEVEYNTDKSAEHPTNEGEDIVRYSFEKRRVQDKEPACNN